MAHNLSSAWLSSVCSSSGQRQVCPELHRHHRLEAPSPEYLSAGPSLAQQLYLAVGNRSGRGPCSQPAVRASPPCAWLRHSSPSPAPPAGSHSRFAVPLSPLPAPVPQDPCSLQAHLWIANNTLTRMLPSAGDASHQPAGAARARGHIPTAVPQPGTQGRANSTVTCFEAL